MVHKFSMDGVNIVVDVNSGAVHVVSPLVYALIESTDNDIEAIKKYTNEEIEEAKAEIDELVKNGMLFSEDTYSQVAEKIKRRPVVKALCLHIAHDCNLRCKYCFAGTGSFCGERSMMPVEVGKKAIDFVIEKSGDRKNIEVDFFGGEPLMNFDVVKELTAYANEQGEKHGKVFRLTITTNGVLLDDEKLEFINENMSNLVLSVDGRKEVHDFMRPAVNGKGSYDVIMPKITKAAESRNQDNYYVRGTFTRHNLDFSNDVLDLANLGFKQISVEPVVGGKETDYALREEDLPTIFDQYEKLAIEYAKRGKTEDWFNFFHFMIDLDQGPCVIKRMSGCGAGCEYVAVTPEGDIYPCHQFVGNKDFCIGNVMDGTYDNEKTTAFANTNVYTKEKCKQCWAKFYCSGGCHANAYQFGGDINNPYEIGCELERKRVECALYIKAKELE